MSSTVTKINPAATARIQLLKKAREAIFKATKQKPMKATGGPLPCISSGSFPIDMLIGGTRCPGYPRRCITEIYGAESSGKTTLAIEAMVQAQKAGGMAMFLDFEHAFDATYAQALGLSYDEDKLMMYQPDSMEDGFKMMYLAIAVGVDIVVVDSVAAMLPKSELDKGFDKEARIGGVAQQFSRQLPKFVQWLHKNPKKADNKDEVDTGHPGTAVIFLNQTRALINTGGYGGGDSETTSGGKALKFYAYLRLRTARIKGESIKRKNSITGKEQNLPFGNVTNVKVVKSKISATQGHSTEMFIRYGQGIDDYFSIIEASVTQKLVKRKGAYFNIGEHQFQGKEKFRQFLMENDTIFEALKEKLALAVIESSGYAPTKLEEGDELLESLNDELGGFDQVEVEEDSEIELDDDTEL